MRYVGDRLTIREMDVQNVSEGQILKRESSRIVGTAEGGGGAGLTNVEGGNADSVYGGIEAIDGGGA